MPPPAGWEYDQDNWAPGEDSNSYWTRQQGRRRSMVPSPSSGSGWGAPAPDSSGRQGGLLGGAPRDSSPQGGRGGVAPWQGPPMNPTGYRPDGGINWNTFSPPGGVAPSAYGPSVMDATGGRTYAPVNPPQGSSAGALPQGYLMGDGTYAPDGVDTPDELSAWLGDAGQSGMRYGAAGPAPYREGAFNPQSVDYSPWDQAQRANEAIANQADTRATAGLGQQLQDMGLGASGASALAQGNLAGQQGLARNQRLGEAAVGRSRFGLAARGQQFGEYAGQRGQGLAEWQAGDASRYRNRLLARSGAPPWSTLYQMGGGRIT